MYLYIKALHIIFVVTWFAGLFYIVRLFIYNREAVDKPDAERNILQAQFTIMIRRLWYGITWPSCILTLILGTWTGLLYGSLPGWLIIKLGFVFGLVLYHLLIHFICRQQISGIFKYTSQQLRQWNEAATVFLVAIVMLAVVKEVMSWMWGLAGLVFLTLLLLLGIYQYRKSRSQDL